MSTTVTIHPASSDLSSGVTLFGGAGNLHTTLTDNTDGTYASFAPGASALTRTGPAGIPATAIVTRIVANVRLHSASPPTAMTVAVARASYRFPAPPSGAYTSLPSTTLGGFTDPGYPAYFNSGAYIVFNAQGGSSAGTILMSEAWVDVTYVSVPTVDAIAPIGTITVTQPTVQWGFSGDYPQAKFQVKIFTSAQTATVGFNPDVSGAFYDSGVQLGSVPSYQPSINLPNSDTYTVYIRAAQQVGSITQWSPWATTTTTVSVTPPAVPTLTLTPDNAMGRIKIDASQAGGPAWDHVTIQRSTDGATWTDVRSASDARTFGSMFTIYDYETGNGQLTQYRALAVITTAGGQIASAWSGIDAALWVSTAIWLKSPTQPTLNTPVTVQDIPVVTRRLPQGRFDVAGRADPVVVSDTRKFVEGSVTFVADFAGDLEAIQALLDRAEPLLLQTPVAAGWGSRYIACGDEDEQRVSPSALEATRLVVVPFTEVRSPVGDVVDSFGISWSDVESTYATWTDVQNANASWAQLLGLVPAGSATGSPYGSGLYGVGDYGG